MWNQGNLEKLSLLAKHLIPAFSIGKMKNAMLLNQKFPSQGRWFGIQSSLRDDSCELCCHSLGNFRDLREAFQLT
jgi:hypothetical protein